MKPEKMLLILAPSLAREKSGQITHALKAARRRANGTGHFDGRQL